MKHGKNPTRRQREYIASLWLNPDNWLVCKDTPDDRDYGLHDRDPAGMQ